MKLEHDEEKFLMEVCKEVDRVIDKLCDKHGFDRAYFNFLLRCEILDNNFRKIGEVDLLKDDRSGFCDFCGARTYFVEDEIYYCAECYGKMKKEVNKEE